MTLTHPWILHFLWLLPLAALALLFCSRQKRKSMEGLADHGLLTRLTGKDRKGRRFLKGLFLLTALSLIVLGLAGPRWGSHYKDVSQKGVEIMIVVDCSPSMLVEDIKPNRLGRARREIRDFLRVVQGDRIGLVAFSGAAFVLCPLTLDYAALQMFVSALQPDLIPVPGTDLGAGIDRGIESFDFKLETDKVIVLITDGEDNENRGFDAAQRAAEKGVKLFVFGVGETRGGPVPAHDGRGGFKKDDEATPILSRLEEEGLRKIASMTGGTYVRSVASDLDLNILYFDGIKSKTEAQTLKTGKIKVYEERFPFFVLAAILLLLLEGLVRERRAVGTLTFFLGLALSTQALAAEHPDELYRKGRFAEAEKAYARLDMDYPRDIRYGYNRGCAAYQNFDYEMAMTAFSSTLKRAEDNEMRFRAAYNLGNTAYKQGDFESAVVYYRRAILYDPESEDARYNLELALRELENGQEDRAEKPNMKPGKDPGQSQEKGDASKIAKSGEGSDKQSQGKATDREPSQAKDRMEDKSQMGPGREAVSRHGEGHGQDKGHRAKQGSPEDLSGVLEALQASPEEGGQDQGSGPALSMIDKKKAEALLDGIKEDRSRFLRFQVPVEKRYGVKSGKDW